MEYNSGNVEALDSYVWCTGFHIKLCITLCNNLEKYVP